MVLRVDRDLHVFPDLESASAAVADGLVHRAAESVVARDRFRWVISGGHTPLPLFKRLAGPRGRAMPWEKTEVFFADERCVAPRESESNFGAAWDALLSKVPISRRRVHRMRGEIRPPSRAASEYARGIGSLTGASTSRSERFDLALLGIGPDGHTASLFPDAPALRERQRTVVAVRRAGQPPFVPRLTMTLPALRSSREVIFLVSGSDKAPAMRGIFRGPPDGSARWPASLVRSTGAVRWYVDRAAGASVLKGLRSAPRRRRPGATPIRE